MAGERHRVVVVGGGFAGLDVVRGLADVDAEIILIDRRNHHLFQPLLYQVATASLSPSEIAWPLRHILRRQRNVSVMMATVTAIDTEAHQVALEDETITSYDTLVLATGAQHAYFGHDEWEQYAPGLKTLEDAIGIRRKLLMALEAAEREADPIARQALLTFAIIGAGPTGVEMAGAMIELGRASIEGQFKNIRPKDLRVVLIEAGERVLSNFEQDLSQYALESLQRLGVEVELGKMVKQIDADGVTYGDSHLSAKTVIWAAGVAASPAAQWLGVEADKAGRIAVGPQLTAPGHQNVFVIGDVASIRADDGSPVPGLAPAAKQEGAYVAKVIASRLSGSADPGPFSYKHAGSLATIGKRSAVIDFGWIKFRGWLAWWIWGVAHIFFLVDIKNRVFVLLSWLWISLTGQRSARLITHGRAPTHTPLDEVDEN